MQKYNTPIPIDIIITTKNRWEELTFTLDKLNSFGIKNQQIFVTDDASDEDITAKINTLYPNINFKRYAKGRGYIPNRNELMDWTNAPYILCLDDDSHIRAKEDIEEAIEIMENNKKYGIFCFKPYEQLPPPPPKENLPNKLVHIKSYIGCGHIIKRHVWNEIGPYYEGFEFYCEELDFSLNAFKNGYSVVMKENLVVHHRIDWDTRHQQFETDLSKGIYGAVWRSMLGFSNHLLIADMHFPPFLKELIKLSQILKRFKNFYLARKDHQGFNQGLKRYFQLSSAAKKKRNALHYSEYKAFRKLSSF